MNNFYITTPIYYVNDAPHIGHAYTSVACDCMARFMRQEGKNVFFLTGTDEHGQKVEKAAQSKGIEPQNFTDEVSQVFKDLTKLLNLSNDDFIRTTQERHKKGAVALWNKLLDNGYIYLGSYAGWYSVRDEAFFLEKDLIEGRAPTGAPVEWVEEPSYFFALSKFQDKLLEFYEQNKEFIYPESRYNEVISFVKSGLTDLSVSRNSFKWGIKIPQNPEHVMYVWLDALANYLTALGYPEDSKLLKSFWPNAYHVVGKDILRFHAVYWPAFLMAAGIELPKKIIAHGWWTINGEKMSKSLGNVVHPQDLVSQFGVDQTRYFLMKEVTFGNDGNFSPEAMIIRINSDLANNIGNLAQRTLAFINKNAGACIPTADLDHIYVEPIISGLEQKITQYREMMHSFKFNQAIEIILEIASEANFYINQKEPWALKKTDIAQMNHVLYVVLENIRYIACLLLPFMPEAMNKMLDLLAVEQDQRGIKFLSRKYALSFGKTLPEPKIIFQRIN
jgi:methionyl-tRNA synthetase